MMASINAHTDVTNEHLVTLLLLLMLFAVPPLLCAERDCNACQCDAIRSHAASSSGVTSSSEYAADYQVAMQSNIKGR
jgi:hypothetical protein